MIFSHQILPFLAIILNLANCEQIFRKFITLKNEPEISTVSDLCARDCETIKIALESNETWALEVQDASGREPIEYFWGNNFFLGSEIECQMLDNSFEESGLVNLSYYKVKSKVPVEYRMIYLTHSSKLQFKVKTYHSRDRKILHIGFCLPKSCSNRDLEVLSKLLIKESFSDQDEVYGDVEFLDSKRIGLRSDFFHDEFVIFGM